MNNLFNITLFTFLITIFFIIYLLNNLYKVNLNIILVNIYFIFTLYIFIKYISNKYLPSIKYIILLLIIILYFYIINFFVKFKNHISKLKILKINKKLKPKKLRIALCVSGKLDENIDKIYNSWKKNLLDFYDVDIFMNIDKENNYIKNIIKPKKYSLYNNIIHKNNNLHKYANLMFFRIYQTNQHRIIYEKENNIKYDLIIRIRSDILLKEKLYLENFTNNYIYFPFRKSVCESSNIYSLGVTDQLFIANPNTMNSICDIYHHLEDYDYIKCKISEVTLLYYLNKINIRYCNFKYNWMINFYNNYNFNNNFKFFKRTFWIFSKSCFINLE